MFDSMAETQFMVCSSEMHKTQSMLKTTGWRQLPAPCANTTGPAAAGAGRREQAGSWGPSTRCHQAIDTLQQRSESASAIQTAAPG
jgi:hypothetical protein